MNNGHQGPPNPGSLHPVQNTSHTIHCQRQRSLSMQFLRSNPPRMPGRNSLSAKYLRLNSPVMPPPRPNGQLIQHLRGNPSRMPPPTYTPPSIQYLRENLPEMLPPLQNSSSVHQYITGDSSGTLLPAQNELSVQYVRVDSSGMPLLVQNASSIQYIRMDSSRILHSRLSRSAMPIPNQNTSLPPALAYTRMNPNMPINRMNYSFHSEQQTHHQVSYPPPSHRVYPNPYCQPHHQNPGFPQQSSVPYPQRPLIPYLQQQSIFHPRFQQIPSARNEPDINQQDEPHQNLSMNECPHTSAANFNISGTQTETHENGFQEIKYLTTNSESQSPSGSSQIQVVHTELSPSVYYHPYYKATNDAKLLYKATKEIDNNINTIIYIIANRNDSHRQKIVTEFEKLYGEKLIECLRAGNPENIGNLIVATMTPLTEFIASELNHALDKTKMDESALIEFFFTASNDEVQNLHETYQRMFGRKYQDDLQHPDSGCFKNLMAALIAGNRDESCFINEVAAMNDAEELLDSGILGITADKAAFNEILLKRSIPQLKVIFELCEELSGQSIENTILKEFSEEIKDTLLSLVRCIMNRERFFAEQLYKTIKSSGINDRRVIRIIVTRCEIDIGGIKSEYNNMFKETLESAISGDDDPLDGSCSRFLLTLISQ